MKRALSWLLLLVLLCGMLPVATAEDLKISYTGTVKEGNLHLRKTASPNGKVLNTYKKGTKVEILENDGTWCKVQIGKRTGYMMASYLEITPNYPHLGWGKTKDDGTILNVRREAKKSADILYKTMSGAVFELVAEQGDWYQVRFGQSLGFLEKKLIEKTTGDFALGFSSKADYQSVTADQMYSAIREVGSPLTRTQEEGDFTFQLTYPELGVKEADQAIGQWLTDVKQLFEADFEKNHKGSKGTLRAEYQSLKVSSRYQSVVLAADYTVDGLTVQRLLTLNIDTETGKLIPAEKLFTRDRAWTLFCLESGISEMMTTPTDGYTGKPEDTWLQHAALTHSGVEVYLPAGLYVPASLGTRKVLLTYYQLAECLTLDSGFMAQFQRVIDPAKPMVALTFDDGPSDQTDRIVKVLAQYNARATFCVIGSKVEAYADVLKRTVAGGNEIACHTWSHPKGLPSKSVATIRSQITKTNDIVQQVAGYTIRVLRPPYGKVGKNVKAVCKENGMFIATWNIDTEDWEHRSTSKTYRAVIKGATNGSIILMHDLYATTASAAEQAIPELVEKGIQLVTISELMSFMKEDIVLGGLYTHLDPKHMKTE